MMLKKKVLSSVCVFCFIFAIFGIAQQETNCIKSTDRQVVKPYFGRDERNNEQNDRYRTNSESIIWAKEPCYKAAKKGVIVKWLFLKFISS